MAISRQQKETALQELKDLFSRAKSVVFGQYRGVSVAQLSKMRRHMREAGVSFKVAKKTLFKLAAKEQGHELPDEIIEGPVGAAFSFEDSIAGPRLMKKMGKEVEALKLMGGILEGQVLLIAQMKEIAELPSKEELLAKFMNLLKTPLNNFYGVLKSPLNSFVRGLQAYAEKRTS